MDNNVNDAPLPGVNSLRSRFEQLSQHQHHHKHTPSTASTSSTISTAPSASPAPAPIPRQRSSSNASDTLKPNSGTGTLHLRNSSSSSDIKSIAKKQKPPPPPPPAPRGSGLGGSRNASPAPGQGQARVDVRRVTPQVDVVDTDVDLPPKPSTTSSSLLRPAPPPPPTSKVTDPDAEEPIPSVSALRNKFSNGLPPASSPSHSPRPSISGLPPSSNISFQPPSPRATLFATPTPALPPRPSHTPSPHPSISIKPGPLIEISPTERTPPAIPPRKSVLHDNGVMSDNDVPTVATKANASPKMPPPRPPPKHRATVAGESPEMSLSLAASVLGQAAPPLPTRPRPGAGAVGFEKEGSPGPVPPPLPERPVLVIPQDGRLDGAGAMSRSAPAVDGRSPVAIGLGRLPPPPTRTIGLGDKLPPARRVSGAVAGANGAGGSDEDDEDSGEEDEPKQASASGGAGVDMLPDRSRTSRRPPVLRLGSGIGHAPPKIPVHAHASGQVAVAIAGDVLVVGGHHHVRVYDLSASGEAVVVKDTKSLLGEGGAGGGGEGKVVSIEFLPLEGGEEMRVWLGTKDGAIVEMVVSGPGAGTVKGVRQVHAHAVGQIVRYDGGMISVDVEGGKCLVFSAAPDEGVKGRGKLELTSAKTRAVRIAEKQDFVKVVKGRVWCASRGDVHYASSSAPGARGGGLPIIRIYELFGAGAGTQRSVVPSEHVGAVTAACVVPSRPGDVFVGHEGGCVSVWRCSNDGDGGERGGDREGEVRCVEVVKVSASDVLCLEGVHDRLWAGGRGGMVSAFDVNNLDAGGSGDAGQGGKGGGGKRPWVVTNSWNAHAGLPVVKLQVDVLGVVKGKGGRLGVLSVGRDEVVRVWDGFMEVDWIENELQKHESMFSTFRPLRVLMVSWNVDSARPDALSASPDAATLNFLHDALASGCDSGGGSPDIIHFGLQEVVDLENRKMAAKSVLLGSLAKASGADTAGVGYSEKVTGAYRRWHEALVNAVRLEMPADAGPYVCVHTESLVGLFSCVFVRKRESVGMRDLSIATVKRGMGGRYGNKGGIIARFVVEDSSICLINCHLAAGQHAVRQRNADVAGMLEEKSVFAATADEPLAYVGGGDGSMVLDHEIVFIGGDMNYRIDQRRETISSAVNAGEFDSLLVHDQLAREMRFNRGFRLRDFSEGHIAFAPTYKYDRLSASYDSSEKRRLPAWCDRILWRAKSQGPGHEKEKEKGKERVRLLPGTYKRYEANVSDHRPISACFEVEVKRVGREVRRDVKEGVRRRWEGEVGRLLEEARVFYEGELVL